ncbi:unnamed protein product, partial [Clonostachys solani]
MEGSTSKLGSEAANFFASLFSASVTTGSTSEADTGNRDVDLRIVSMGLTRSSVLLRRGTGRKISPGS